MPTVCVKGHGYLLHGDVGGPEEVGGGPHDVLYVLLAALEPLLKKTHLPSGQVYLQLTSHMINSTHTYLNTSHKILLNFSWNFFI